MDYKPDIVVWKPSLSQVILFELTVCCDTNISTASAQRQGSRLSLLRPLPRRPATPVISIHGSRGIIDLNSLRPSLQLVNVPSQGSIQWGGGGGGGGASTPNSPASTPKKFQLQYKLLWSRPYLSVKVYLEWSKMASNATLYNLKTQISPREAFIYCNTQAGFPPKILILDRTLQQSYPTTSGFDCHHSHQGILYDLLETQHC